MHLDVYRDGMLFPRENNPRAGEMRMPLKVESVRHTDNGGVEVTVTFMASSLAVYPGNNPHKI